MPELAWLDAEDEPLSLDPASPLAMGAVTQGEASEPVRAQVKNEGDEDALFVKVRSIRHPAAQVGPGSASYLETRFAASEDGDFQPELELGTIPAGEARDVWVQWTVPEGAAAGELVWAVEALGAKT